MDLGLKDKSVVITGGASNIGRGIVLAFAGEGAHITVGDLDDEQAEKVAELARKKGAASVQVVKTDVTDLDQVKAMFKAATDRHGTVDVLVNNVGWDQFMFFTQTTPELWQKIIHVRAPSRRARPARPGGRAATVQVPVPQAKRDHVGQPDRTTAGQQDSHPGAAAAAQDRAEGAAQSAASG